MAEPTLGDYLRHLRSASPAGRAARNGLLGRTQLAARASLSVGYLIKLEQGRAGRPSPDVLDRIAAALGIGAAERTHLHDLVRHAADGTAAAVPAPVVSPAMAAAADNLHPHLAGYFGETWDVLYCNAEYARTYRHLTVAGNLLKWFFFVPESRSVMVDWEAEARLAVASFRAHMARRPGHPGFGALLQELAGSPEFRRMWELREISMGRDSQQVLVRDPDSGEERSFLAQVYSWPDPAQGVRLCLGVRADVPGCPLSPGCPEGASVAG